MMRLLLISPSPAPGVVEDGSPSGALIGVAAVVLLLALLAAGRDVGRRNR